MMKIHGKNRLFFFFIFFTIFSSYTLILCSRSTSGDISPLIYTENKEIAFTQGFSLNIVWIVIDNDPKKYWITNTFENEEIYLQSETPYTISRIEINPVGIPIGENVIKLYIEDFSSQVSISAVEVNVTPGSMDTTTATPAQTTSPQTSLDSVGGASGFFLSIPALPFILSLKLAHKKLRRRENEK